MRIGRLIAATATSVAVVLGSPSPAVAASGQTPREVLNVAHRGATAQAPEHTLAALDGAVADHADRMSIDVRMTGDGVPIVMHDATLTRTTDVEERFPLATSYLVGDFTLAQVRTLDAGGWFGDGDFTGSRVLTLDEVLTELADSPSGLTVEVKNPDGADGVDGIGDAVMAVLANHPEWTGPSGGGSPRLVMESFRWAFLDGMHQAYPELPLVLLGNVTAEDMDAHPYADEIDVPRGWLGTDLVAAAHLRGKRVGVWTVNGSVPLGEVLDQDVDTVTSDEPGLLGQILATRGSTWSGTTWPAVPPIAAVRLDVSTAMLGGRVHVRARPTDGSGGPVRWVEVEFQSLVGGAWSAVAGSATDSHGSASVLLPVVEGIQVRAVVAGRASPVAAPIIRVPPVALPAGAPAPSNPLAAQTRTTTAGARPQVAALPSSVWRQMAGRSWRRGCPVGRAGLRLLRVSYWGFEGRRHRGELVVARGTAAQLGRVFSTLYAQRQPIRSMRRVESLGGWGSAVGTALRGDATFGFACQRTPGNPRPVGTHALGTVVSVNPWENPSSVAGTGDPNAWWLSRTRSLSYVHASADAVVSAFARQGFAWNGGSGRYAEFRDVR